MTWKTTRLGLSADEYEFQATVEHPLCPASPPDGSGWFLISVNGTEGVTAHFFWARKKKKKDSPANQAG